jgi:hypothetical protein
MVKKKYKHKCISPIVYRYRNKITIGIRMIFFLLRGISYENYGESVITNTFLCSVTAEMSIIPVYLLGSCPFIGKEFKFSTGGKLWSRTSTQER